MTTLCRRAERESAEPSRERSVEDCHDRRLRRSPTKERTNSGTDLVRVNTGHRGLASAPIYDAKRPVPGSQHHRLISCSEQNSAVAEKPIGIQDVAGVEDADGNRIVEF